MNYSDKIATAITDEIITTEDLDKYIQGVVENHIDNLYDQHYTTQLVELLDSNEELCRMCIVTGYNYVTLYKRASSDCSLHDIREQLRITLGSWSDSINNSYVNGDELQVIHQGKQKYNNVNIDVVMYYPLDNIPEGLLKPSCKIVESTCKSIQCEI